MAHWHKECTFEVVDKAARLKTINGHVVSPEITWKAGTDSGITGSPLAVQVFFCPDIV